MLPKVPVAVAVTGESIEFRFAESVSLFMLVVSRGDEVVWELVANEGNMVKGEVSITPLEQATPEMLNMAQQAEVLFLARVRVGSPITTPVSAVRYGVIPPGYRETAPARQLAAGRYDLMGMCAQGHVEVAFDVPAA